MPPPNEAQRALLDEWRQISAQQFERHADAWRAGRITLADFELLFKQELKDLYIAATWTATGGPDETTFADYGRVGRRLRDQYQFMHGLFQEIEQGKLSPAQIKDRMNRFGNSAGVMLEEIGNSDLPRLPHYPKDGSTQCRTNCKCTLERVQVKNGWDVYWRVHPAEHCGDCKRREDKAVKIRAGKIINPEVWD